MRTEDGYIIHKCLNGDSAAFGFLVNKYRAGVYASAYDQLRNFHDAEDITQEVFFKAYRSLRALKRWDSFASWLYRITLNLCKDWIRAESRRPDHEFVEDQNQEALETPSANVYRQELVCELVRETLDSLPEMYCQALTLHYLGGMTSEEIGRFVGASPAAIRMRLGKGRSLLKEEILAMMNTTFEERKLQATFTSSIMEGIKRIKINPLSSMKGVPWGISLAAGILLTVLGLNSYMSKSTSVHIPINSPPSVQASMLAVGETPVDILAASQLSIQAGDQRDGNPKLMDLRLEQLEMVLRHTIERSENMIRQQQILLEQLKSQLAEIEQLREALGDISTITRVPAVTRSQRLPIPQSAFPALCEPSIGEIPGLPEQKVERLIQNGDFRSGLDGWEKSVSADRMNSTMTCEIVYDEDAQSNVIEFKREGGRADGGMVGAFQDVYIDLSKYEDVRIKLDAKPVFQSLAGSGGASGEYPVNVQIAYIDQRGESHVWAYGFYYRGDSRYKNSTKVDQNAWFTYTSPNLKEIDPDCEDEYRVSDGKRYGHEIHEYKPPVTPSHIVRVLVLGSGWDHAGRANNIEFIMTPR